MKKIENNYLTHKTSCGGAQCELLGQSLLALPTALRGTRAYPALC